MTAKCDCCGKFLSYDEMEDGARFYFEPLNEFGPEVIEWTCLKCIQKEAA